MFAHPLSAMSKHWGKKISRKFPRMFARKCKFATLKLYMRSIKREYLIDGIKANEYDGVDSMGFSLKMSELHVILSPCSTNSGQ